MNETSTALARPSTSGHLVLPGVWALTNGEEVALGGRVGRLFARWLDLGTVYAALFATSLALTLPSLAVSIVAGTLCVGVVLGQLVGVALWGRSLGKLVFGLKIVHRSGRPIGAIRGLLLREGVRFLLELTGVLVLLDLALIFREDRRTLHDLVCGSVVIHQPVEWERLRSGWAERNAALSP